jgi:hypothetical protein
MAPDLNPEVSGKAAAVQTDTVTIVMVHEQQLSRGENVAER